MCFDWLNLNIILVKISYILELSIVIHRVDQRHTALILICTMLETFQYILYLLKNSFIHGQLSTYEIVTCFHRKAPDLPAPDNVVHIKRQWACQHAAYSDSLSKQIMCTQQCTSVADQTCALPILSFGSESFSLTQLLTDWENSSDVVEVIMTLKDSNRGLIMKLNW